MNTEHFIAKRIIFQSKDNKQFSRPIIKISVIGVALGIALMILTIAVVNGFQEEIRSKLIGFGSHIQITNYDDNISDEPKPINKNQPFINTLLSHENIHHLQICATKNGIIKAENDTEGIVVKGVGNDYDWAFINKHIKQGSTFIVPDTVSRDIVISQYLSNKLNLQLNDKMNIYFLSQKEVDGNKQYEQRGKAFYVKGIYETGLEEIDKKLIFADIKQIQKINYWDSSQIGGFEISINNYKKLDETAEFVDGEIGHELMTQTIKQINPSIFSWIELQDVNAIIVIVIMLIVASINMVSALLILILERTNMIGLLKAIGASNSSIQKIFLYNAFYLILKGLIYGNVLGIGIALLQQKFQFIKLDPQQYYVSAVPIQIDTITILLLNLGTILICMIVLTIPSLIISKITPVKAIRFS